MRYFACPAAFSNVFQSQSRGHFLLQSGRMKAVAAVRRKGSNNLEVSLSSIPGSTTVKMAPLATASSLSAFMARAQMAANKMFTMQRVTSDDQCTISFFTIC